MYERKIVRDAQEVKRRLAFIGQDDIDETVICDLLRSYGSDYTLDSVMDIILGTSNKISDCEQVTIKMESPDVTITKAENTDHTVVKLGNNTNNTEISLSMDNAPIEIEDSSGSDEDDDGYYHNQNWEDISYVDSVSQPSPPILITVCADTPAPIQSIDETSTMTGVEILEENNNDPNNNLDSIQIIQEEANYESTPDVQNDTFEDHSVKCLGSPQPGCSQDIETEHDAGRNKIRTEAQQICNLLPRLSYTAVYKTLLKNYKATNRVELTVWDLLPDKRPNPQYSAKRKPMDDDDIMDNCVDTCSNVPKPKMMRGTNTDKFTSDSNKESTTTQFQRLCNPLNNGMWSSQYKFSACSFSTVGKIFSQVSEESNTIFASTQALNDKTSKDPSCSTGHQSLVEKSSVSKNNISVSKNTILRSPMLNISKFCQNLSSANQKVLNSTVKQMQCDTGSVRGDKLPTNSRNSIIKPARLIHNSTLSQTINNTLSSTNCDSDMLVLAESHCTQTVTEQNAISFPTSTNDVQPSCASSITTSNAKGASSETITSSTTDRCADSFPMADTSNTESIDCGSSCQVSFSGISAKENSPSPSTSTNVVISSDDLTEQVASTSSSGASEAISSNHDLPSQESVDAPTNSDETVTCTSCHSVEEDNQRLIDILKTGKSLQSKACLRIYRKLAARFPLVDKNYLKQLCATKMQNFKNEKHINELERLNNLTEHLLNNEDVHSPETETTSDDITINEQYANLLGIFPDADPTYLAKTAREMYNKPDELRAFIQIKLETRDYPTREQYYARQKITEQQKQYTTDFDVRQFLQIFPDPFAYFEDPKRQCRFDTDAFEFLKFHFNRIKVATLMNHYSRNKHHLSLTAEAVKKLAPDVKNKRLKTLYVPENIPLLQEIAFIVHREEIAKYTNELKAKEYQEFQELKEKNELLQCECCYDDECMPSKCSSCDNAHIFCNTCIVRGTEAKLANGQTRIPCFTNCDGEFELSVLQRVLPPTKFSIILRKRQEEEVMAAGLEGLVSCPFCHFASIPPPGDRVFKCLNPECMKESCRDCKELNHVPLNCKEVKSSKARLYLEEKMTEALVRTCYRCGRPFFKEDGCNKIHCVCGAIMCYICDKPIKGYGHFNLKVTSSVNRSELKICPLWSDNQCINAATVLKVAEETVKHIKQQDPNVQINTTGLLPEIPTNTNANQEASSESGLNSSAIRVRAQKIARFDS